MPKKIKPCEECQHRSPGCECCCQKLALWDKKHPSHTMAAEVEERNAQAEKNGLSDKWRRGEDWLSAHRKAKAAARRKTKANETIKLEVRMLAGEQLTEKERMQVYNHNYYIEHRQQRIAKNKKYYQEHREESIAQRKAYYQAHRDEIIAYQHEYNETHREERSARRRQRYKEATNDK